MCRSFRFSLVAWVVRPISLCPLATPHGSKSPTTILPLSLYHKLSSESLLSTPKMPTSRSAVANLYGKIADYENNRLATHPMEREITLRAISQALATSETSPAERKRIADVGGGPGKIAFALADQGHHVDLIDLSPDLIRLAQVEQDQRGASDENQALLESISVGDALDKIPLTNDSYDAVLLLGPLYHLMEETERKQAVENALSLAKPRGGFIFCAFISKEAHLRDIAMRDPARLLRQKDFYTKYVRLHRSHTLS